jgi:hypothetical protein
LGGDAGGDTRYRLRYSGHGPQRDLVPSSRGEGGPQEASSPAVAGRGPHVLLVVGMRGHFRRLDHGLPEMHNRRSAAIRPSEEDRGSKHPRTPYFGSLKARDTSTVWGHIHPGAFAHGGRHLRPNRSRSRRCYLSICFLMIPVNHHTKQVSVFLIVKINCGILAQCSQNSCSEAAIWN